MNEQLFKDSTESYLEERNESGIILPNIDYVDPFGKEQIIKPTLEFNYLNGETRFNKEQKIAGYTITELNSFLDLFDLMDKESYDKNARLAQQSFEWVNDVSTSTNDIFVAKLQAIATLKGKHGKIYHYKRTVVDNGRKNGIMTHSVSYWEDITYLKPKTLDHLICEIKGIGTLDLNEQEINYFQKIFTNREREILGFINRGFNSNEISRTLNISPHTVKTHRKNMLKKLDVSNSAQLLLKSREMGLI
ncbi:response regulator transcription factor [Sediminitomix flava]|uniref:Regulatory LuxR family protein n=1 Tax=Sediminitomix flava TaxID=379075 RepID=A0A315YYL2_SEDFL|nr:LuxR C-terminal-related transcriptional regulator [Sediminitomix flava]PWJ34979.1 regulatory LuxR family protein [Sediminitomix flava]